MNALQSPNTYRALTLWFESRGITNRPVDPVARAGRCEVSYDVGGGEGAERRDFTKTGLAGSKPLLARASRLGVAGKARYRVRRSSGELHSVIIC